LFCFVFLTQVEIVFWPTFHIECQLHVEKLYPLSWVNRLLYGYSSVPLLDFWEPEVFNDGPAEVAWLMKPGFNPIM